MVSEDFRKFYMTQNLAFIKQKSSKHPMKSSPDLTTLSHLENDNWKNEIEKYGIDIPLH
jgi:hypothetical protein